MTARRKEIACVIFALLVASSGVNAFILDEEIFAHPSTDSLAPRDGYGVLHQSPALNPTDFDPRYRLRWVYYLKPPEQLVMEPAYIGALQRDLHRVGYYCGPVDGIFSAEVSEAIARLQKNYSMRVTGTLTVPVRRALHLP